MQKRLTPILLALVVVAIGCQKSKKEQDSPEPSPPKPLAKMAKAAISSVQILQDCPDPKPESPKVEPVPAKAAEDPPARRAPAESRPAAMQAPADMAVVGGERYINPCEQSTIQIDFAGQGPESAKVVIQSLRLLTPEGKTLATLASRAPTMWQEGGYAAWDQVLPPDADLKASYKITPPNWSEVEATLEGPSHGRMFVLEATMEVGGQVQVVRSSAFARFRPEAVPT